MPNPLFIGHGSPKNINANNSYTKFLQSYALSIKEPKVIIVISAHWQTQGTFITGNKNPEQIFDFYGFSNELYAINYKPYGSPEIAKLIQDSNLDIKVDNNRGIDHSGWSIVKHMFPLQNIPLLQISLDINKSEREHYILGQKLANFIEKDILFIGSGNIVHNLQEVNFIENTKAFEWAIEADKWIGDAINSYSINKLINYKSNLPNYQKALPTDEHFLPLLYILAMKKNGQKINTIYQEIQNGSISMRSIEIAEI